MTDEILNKGNDLQFLISDCGRHIQDLEDKGRINSSIQPDLVSLLIACCKRYKSKKQKEFRDLKTD